MASIGEYIEKRLKLVVNREKSQVARSDRVKFLGLTIVGDTIAISRKALQAAMDKVKDTFAVSRAYPVGWFIGEMGQAIRSDKQLPHWFEVSQWIRLA